MIALASNFHKSKVNIYHTAILEKKGDPMSIATPKGFNMSQFSTRGGQSADIYSQLAQAFPELLAQAKGAPGAFEAQEGQAKDFYNQKLAPGIAQRYAGSGIGSSSGLQNSLTAGARGLTNDLYSQRQELMQNSMRNVLSLGDLLLQRPDVENYYSQKQKGPSGWNQAIGIGAPIVGATLGLIPGFGPMIGGPVGGAKTGYEFGKAFLT